MVLKPIITKNNLRIPLSFCYSDPLCNDILRNLTCL